MSTPVDVMAQTFGEVLLSVKDLSLTLGGHQILKDLSFEVRDRTRSDAVTGQLVGLLGPSGVGKTVVGTYMVAARGCSTLVLVHRRPILDQWLAQLSLFPV